MFQDELLLTVFSSLISFSAILIVVITFMLMMYDARRDSPDLARPYRRASILITFLVFIPSILTAISVFLMLILKNSHFVLQYYNILLKIILSVFIFSLFSTIIGTVWIVKIVTKKILRW